MVGGAEFTSLVWQGFFCFWLEVGDASGFDWPELLSVKSAGRFGCNSPFECTVFDVLGPVRRKGRPGAAVHALAA